MSYMPSEDVFERRGAPRFHFDLVMPATLGRGAAMIHDISSTGARISHFTPQPLEMPVRLMFLYRGRRFYATARLLTSRVREIGTGPFGATTYESRLCFVDCSLEAIESLERIISQIAVEREEQRQNAAAAEADRPMLRLHEVNDNSGYYISCRLQNRRWVKCWTRDAAQPEDGFTVPAILGEGEVEMLCRAYEQMDDRSKVLIHAAAEGANQDRFAVTRMRGPRGARRTA